MASRKKKSVLSLNNWITLVLSTFYTSISSIPDMFWDSHFAIKFGILPCPNYSNKLFLEFSKPWRFLHAKEMSSDEGAVGGNTPNSLLHTIVELKMAMSFQIAVNIHSSVKIVISCTSCSPICPMVQTCPSTLLSLVNTPEAHLKPFSRMWGSSSQTPRDNQQTGEITMGHH